MSVKDRLRQIRSQTKAQAAAEDDGPDVSGLNDKPATSVMDSVAAKLSPETPLGAAAIKLPQGLSYKLSDEMQGAFEASHELSKAAREKLGLDAPQVVEADPLTGEADRAGLIRRILDAYNRGTRSARDDLAVAQAAQPGLSTASELVGSVFAPAPPVAKMGKGATALQRALAYGKAGLPVGAGFGFGGSEGDDAGEVIADTAKGAAAGFGGSALLGGLLHRPLSRLESVERNAIERAHSESQKAAEKALNSARGSLGGKTQVGSRQTESLQAGLDDPSIQGASKDAIKALMADPKWAALRQGVIENQLDAVPGQLSTINAAKAELEAAKLGAMPSAVDKAAQEMLSSKEAARQVARRLKTYASRAIPPIIGSTVGSSVGGAEGAALGGLLGFGASAALGAPGTALANMIRHPAVASRVAAAAEYPARSQAPQKAALDALMEDESMRALVEKLRAANKTGGN